MIEIVRLDEDDAVLLSSVGGISLVESHGHSAASEIMEAYRQKSFSEAACRVELTNRANHFYGMWNNGSLAGYSKFIYRSAHPEIPLQPITKLERLYLLKEYYGRQLGHQLLQHAISQSKSAGEKGMWLNVWKGNERAITFYEKEGFKTVGEAQFVLTSTHSNPNWVMLLIY